MAKTRKAMKPKQPAASELAVNEDSTNVFEVEKILDKKDSSTSGLQYYVKWKGYPATENTWEPADNILQRTLIKDFEKRQAAGPIKRGPRKTAKKAESEEPEEEEGDDATLMADDEEANASNVDEEEEAEEEQNEEEEAVEEEEEVAEEPEPVKPKRARTTATKVATKKAPVPKSKAQPKSKNDPEPEPTKSLVKIKMAPQAKRAAEPKAKRVVEPKANKTTSQAKVKANPIEAKKAPTRRNIPLKRTAASAAKDISMEKAQEENEPVEDEVEDVLDSPGQDEEKAAITNGINEIEFSEVKLDRLINESLCSKMITFFGTYKGEDAVILLEKTVFSESDVKKALGDKKTIVESDFQNDIYHSYKIKSSDNTSSLNNIKATVVYPADETVFAKYSRDETIFFAESPDVYSKVVDPFIDSIVKSESDPNRWLYNILDGKSEADRIIFNDQDPNSGFMLVPDLKWSGDVKDLYLVAICHRRDLRSLRDLNEKHLTLLNNIMTKGTKAIKDKFKDFKGQLRSYIHYQPSFYHFHVHFKVVDGYEVKCSDRDNLLATVINNINLKKDYYKKSVLVYPLSQSHALYRELEKAKRI